MAGLLIRRIDTYEAKQSRPEVEIDYSALQNFQSNLDKAEE